jgi:hypothetical protein
MASTATASRVSGASPAPPCRSRPVIIQLRPAQIVTAHIAGIVFSIAFVIGLTATLALALQAVFVTR